MGGSLGEKIGEGAFADVHAWAPGQVVKLFKAEIPGRIPWYEARMTQAVFAAGGPALEVLDEVKLDGRRGFVLPRLEGPTLLQQLRAGDTTPGEAGAILARLAIAVHETEAPAIALPLRDYMEGSLRLREDLIPAPLAARVLAQIERLPPGLGLSHCDLHPGNVIVTPAGPRLIDWTGAKRGGGAHDLACCHFLLTDLVPEILGAPEGQRALAAAMQSAYARLAAQAPSALRAAIETHLPIVWAFWLLAGMGRTATQARVLKRLATDLAEEA